jgi:PAS domain S-box-containing protein
MNSGIPTLSLRILTIGRDGRPGGNRYIEAAAIRHMENELRRIVDALPGLFWTALPNGQADFTNQRWCEYTGLTASEAAGEGWLGAIHPADLAGLRAAWHSILASGVAGELQARMRRRDGTYRWFHFNAAPIGDASGRIVKWCGINTDIDDRKRTEDAVRAREHRSQLIVDGLPAIVTLMNADGALEDANALPARVFRTVARGAQRHAGGLDVSSG